MSRTVVLVDAYSAANQYAPLWRGRGDRLIHVQSAPEIPEGYRRSYRPGDFAAHVVHEGDVAETARKIAAHEPAVCMAGIETGVELAEALAARLGLPTNRPDRAAARRDKSAMVEAAQDAGLRVPASRVVTTVDDGVEWSQGTRRWPLVVKPPKSAGADGVSFCRNGDEVRASLEAILGGVNRLGLVNDFALVQEFISGPEYAVNAVSGNGQHRFTHIWKYEKVDLGDFHFVYDWEKLLDPKSDEAESLFRYAAKLLDALGVQHGPSHCEIKADDEGPCLIEATARVDGIANVELDRQIIGTSQVELAIEAMSDPEAFAAQTPKRYRHEKVASNVSLIGKKRGRVKRVSVEEVLAKRCASFVGASLRIGEGDFVEPTRDLFTSPGMVYLAASSQAELERDYALIRELEAEGVLYDVEES